MPHASSWLADQSAAALKAGVAVSRGPITLVKTLNVSMTCERSSPSALIWAMTS